MKYPEEAFDYMQARLDERRNAAEEELEKRRAYVYERQPKVRELEKELKNIYFELYRIIASHSSDAAEQAKEAAEKNLAAQREIKRLTAELTGDENFLEPVYTCNFCNDTGIRDGKRCDCAKELLRNYMIEQLNENSSISTSDLSHFDTSFYPAGEVRDRMSSFLRYFKSYCENFPNGCRSALFTGRTGLGKTFLSSCIAGELARRGFSVLLCSAPDILRRIENEHFGRSEGCTLDSVIEADIAIIDDLGSEFIGPFYESALYNIINGRLNFKRPTIISTNLDETKLSERYNERIASRILNEYMPFMFIGRDIRQIKAQRLYKK